MLGENYSKQIQGPNAKLRGNGMTDGIKPYDRKNFIRSTDYNHYSKEMIPAYKKQDRRN